ncbi:Uncharacterized membrane protein YciS, DUF1049 family [Alteromonadaceae bacterium Bs31]|nr:Uncharacterized membrane protein YciS, DUF1049 family [Alteromonadaceae bacterium Bs31]
MFLKLFRFIRFIFVVAWFILVVVISMWIAYANSDPLSLNLLGFQLPELTTGTYLGATFAIGATFGWFGTWLIARIKLFSRKRELKKTKKEVEKLRTAHLQESH